MIKLTCIGHDTEFEINNIIHLFEPYMEGEYDLQSTLEGNEASAKLLKVGVVLYECTRQVEPADNEIKLKKNRKLVLKEAVYDVLYQLTGKQMPWGMLTGIRPTKIVHDYQKQGMSDKVLRARLKDVYRISDAKIDLMMEVAKAEEEILEKNQKDEISLYIGIPFCPTRCVYCSFTAYSLEAKRNQVESYLDALCKEITFIAEAKKDHPIRSLYIGGGTPTSLNEAQLERLLKHIKASFNLENVGEYTIEAGRPDTITREKLEIMKAMDVGRISINPQSMNQKTLDTIGRHHTVEDIIEVFNIARELGHDNINMDIILGLPGEGVVEVRHTLEELKKLGPENITVHTMAIKRASRLKEQQDDYQLAEATKIEQMLDISQRACRAMGLAPYYMYRQKNMLGNFENVGYAKPGYECVYNVEIMEESESIIAAGAGAITKMVYQNGERIDRIANVKSLEDYIGRIDEMIERKREGFEKYR
ncbi:coproporphyrinogen dehydrogenase HemZ [Niameybacter massiliensis]|uniref:Coproporphyrinogen dehydrogenase HemZ n=1 Tax=Holtiella tumoricola TaxID=3018743 RepID=A0AA42J0M4_9FIRM|nr:MULTISPECIES: coproporphyrinogen dehydrogenase HemZ [Lachnospirales]MDA3731495.1 coproporphyrinogen dehydrogenase HemZ [Holtiella tumoricola]